MAVAAGTASAELRPVSPTIEEIRMSPDQDLPTLVPAVQFANADGHSKQADPVHGAPAFELAGKPPPVRPTMHAPETMARVSSRSRHRRSRSAGRPLRRASARRPTARLSTAGGGRHSDRHAATSSLQHYSVEMPVGEAQLGGPDDSWTGSNDSRLASAGSLLGSQLQSNSHFRPGPEYTERKLVYIGAKGGGTTRRSGSRSRSPQRRSPSPPPTAKSPPPQAAKAPGVAAASLDVPYDAAAFVAEMHNGLGPAEWPSHRTTARPHSPSADGALPMREELPLLSPGLAMILGASTSLRPTEEDADPANMRVTVPTEAPSMMSISRARTSWARRGVWNGSLAPREAERPPPPSRPDPHWEPAMVPLNVRRRPRLWRQDTAGWVDPFEIFVGNEESGGSVMRKGGKPGLRRVKSLPPLQPGVGSAASAADSTAAEQAARDAAAEEERRMEDELREAARAEAHTNTMRRTMADQLLVRIMGSRPPAQRAGGGVFNPFSSQALHDSVPVWLAQDIGAADYSFPDEQDSRPPSGASAVTDDGGDVIEEMRRLSTAQFVDIAKLEAANDQREREDLEAARRARELEDERDAEARAAAQAKQRGAGDAKFWAMRDNARARAVMQRERKAAMMLRSAKHAEARAHAALAQAIGRVSMLRSAAARAKQEATRERYAEAETRIALQEAEARATGDEAAAAEAKRVHAEARRVAAKEQAKADEAARVAEVEAAALVAAADSARNEVLEASRRALEESRAKEDAARRQGEEQPEQPEEPPAPQQSSITDSIRAKARARAMSTEAAVDEGKGNGPIASHLRHERGAAELHVEVESPAPTPTRVRGASVATEDDGAEGKGVEDIDSSWSIHGLVAEETVERGQAAGETNDSGVPGVYVFQSGGVGAGESLYTEASGVTEGDDDGESPANRNSKRATSGSPKRAVSREKRRRVLRKRNTMRGLGQGAMRRGAELPSPRSLMRLRLQKNARRVVGRELIVENLRDHLIGCTQGAPIGRLPVMVAGEVGCGKSALISALVARLEVDDEIEPTIITHLIGASPASGDIRATLLRLCKEISAEFRLALSSTFRPENYQVVRHEFVRLLQLASVKVMTPSRVDGIEAGTQPLIIMVDGVNHLHPEHNALSMDWLPMSLPIGVAIIVTTNTDSPTFKALSSRMPVLPLFSPALLTQMERRVVIDSSLARTFPDGVPAEIVDALADKEHGGRPRYLVYCCNEIRRAVNTSRQTLPGLIALATNFPGETTRLVLFVMQRIEEDVSQWFVHHGKGINILRLRRWPNYTREEDDVDGEIDDSFDGNSEDIAKRSGYALMRNVFSLLYCGQLGLRELELIELLAPIGLRLLPDKLWHAMKPGLISFAEHMGTGPASVYAVHQDDICEAILERYLQPHSHGERGVKDDNANVKLSAPAVYRILEAYYFNKVDPNGDETFASTDMRSFHALLFYQVRGLHLSTMAQTLCGLRFIEAIAHMGPEELQTLLEAYHQAIKIVHDAKYSDLKDVLKKMNTTRDEQLAYLSEFAAFVGSNRSALIRQPHIAVQLAMIQPKGTAPAQKSAELLVGHLAALKYLIRTIPGKRKPEELPKRALAAFGGKIPSESELERSVSALPRWWFEPVNKNRRRRLLMDYGPFRTEGACIDLDPIPTPSGDTAVAVGGHDGGITFVNVNTGDVIREIRYDASRRHSRPATAESVESRHSSGHTAGVTCLEYTSDGSVLATGGHDHAICIWAAQTGTQICKLTEHMRSISAIAWVTPPLRMSKRKPVTPTPGMSGSIDKGDRLSPRGNVRLKSRGRLLVSASMDRSLRLWAEADEVTSRPGTPDDRSGSPAGNRVTYETIWMLDFLRSPFLSLSYTPDALCLVGGRADGKVALWDTAAGRLQLVGLSEFTAHEFSSVTGAELNKFGNVIATGGLDNTVKLWRPASSPVGGIDSSGWEPMSMVGKGHTGGVTSLRFAQDGSHFVTTGLDNNLILWSTDGGLALAFCTDHTKPVYGAVYLADIEHPRLVSCAEDRTVKVWDATVVNRGTGREEAEVMHVTERKTKKSSHEKRASFALADSAGRRAAQTGSRAPPTKHAAAVSAVAVHPSGHICATGGKDCEIKIWDLTTGEPTFVLLGHSSPITALCFHWKQQVLISGDATGHISLWRGAYFDNRYNNLAHRGSAITAVRFVEGSLVPGFDRVADIDPEDTRARDPMDSVAVFTGAANGSVKVWQASTAVPVPDFPHLNVDFSVIRLLFLEAGQDGIPLTSAPVHLETHGRYSKHTLIQDLVKPGAIVQGRTPAPDKTRLIVINSKGLLCVYDVNNGYAPLHVEEIPFVRRDVAALAISEDGARLAACYNLAMPPPEVPGTKSRSDSVQSVVASSTGSKTPVAEAPRAEPAIPVLSSQPSTRGPRHGQTAEQPATRGPRRGGLSDESQSTRSVSSPTARRTKVGTPGSQSMDDRPPSQARSKVVQQRRATRIALMSAAASPLTRRRRTPTSDVREKRSASIFGDSDREVRAKAKSKSRDDSKKRKAEKKRKRSVHKEEARLVMQEKAAAAAREKHRRWREQMLDPRPAMIVSGLVQLDTGVRVPLLVQDTPTASPNNLGVRGLGRLGPIKLLEEFPGFEPTDVQTIEDESMMHKLARRIQAAARSKWSWVAMQISLSVAKRNRDRKDMSAKELAERREKTLRWINADRLERLMRRRERLGEVDGIPRPASAPSMALRKWDRDVYRPPKPRLVGARHNYRPSSATTGLLMWKWEPPQLTGELDDEFGRAFLQARSPTSRGSRRPASTRMLSPSVAVGLKASKEEAFGKAVDPGLGIHLPAKVRKPQAGLPLLWGPPCPADGTTHSSHHWIAQRLDARAKERESGRKRTPFVKHKPLALMRKERAMGVPSALSAPPKKPKRKRRASQPDVGADRVPDWVMSHRIPLVPHKVIANQGEVAIQARMKGRIARRALKKRQDAATKLQAVARGRAQRNESKKQDQAAAVIARHLQALKKGKDVRAKMKLGLSRSMPGTCRCVAFSTDGTLMVSGGASLLSVHEAARPDTGPIAEFPLAHAVSAVAIGPALDPLSWPHTQSIGSAAATTYHLPGSGDGRLGVIVAGDDTGEVHIIRLVDTLRLSEAELLVEELTRDEEELLEAVVGEESKRRPSVVEQTPMPGSEKLKFEATDRTARITTLPVQLDPTKIVDVEYAHDVLTRTLEISLPDEPFSRSLLCDALGEPVVDDPLSEDFFSKPRALICSWGGAAGLHALLVPNLKNMLGMGLVEAAVSCGAMMIDGGTRSGVMAMLGAGLRLYEEGVIRLIGVSPGECVSKPGYDPNPELAELEPHHSNNVLVPSGEWGGETSSMFTLIKSAKKYLPTIGVVSNGGYISKMEVLEAARLAIPTIVISGSGRLANELTRWIGDRDKAVAVGETFDLAQISDPDVREIMEKGVLSLIDVTESPETLRKAVASLLHQELQRGLKEAAEDSPAAEASS